MAYATKPSPVSFQETLIGDEVDLVPPKIAGINVIVKQEVSGAWTGGIEGTFTAVYSAVLHKWADGPPMGMITVQANYEVDSTVQGKSGLLYMQLNYKVIQPTDTTPAKATGSWVITGGTGELANLHGQGAFNWVINPPNPIIRQFDGQIHFNPQ